jgi:hypothetical protein
MKNIYFCYWLLKTVDIKNKFFFADYLNHSTPKIDIFYVSHIRRSTLKIEAHFYVDCNY